jgi:transcriptional regulator with XRE-family HTH domain
MAKSFQELRSKMSPSSKAASAAEYTRLTEELSLQELRKARELTQTSIAAELEIAQGDVSKLERRTDMHISTLANYLHAVGVELEIRAVFPDGHAVKITQFAEEPRSIR